MALANFSRDEVFDFQKNYFNDVLKPDQTYY